jgi:predicted dinucleotide-binding enzyme
MTAGSNETIAVVGGTGELGGALARRLVSAGRTLEGKVVIVRPLVAQAF